MKSFWNIFSAAPHRLFFFSGAIQLILPLLIWAIELVGRYTELWTPLNTIFPITWAHGFVMIFGVFIFFIFGFLMTVFPRWMNAPLISKEDYSAVFIWLNIGLIVFEISLFTSRTSALSGLLIFLFGWLYGVFALYRCYKLAPAQDKRYETILLLALIAGSAGVASYAMWVFSNNWLLLNASINIGLWLYLLPVLFSVSHRMLPFFSSNIISDYKIYQPGLTLWLFLSACIAHFTLDQLNLLSWLFLSDIPLAAIALLHSFRWQLHRSFKDRLLAVLHMAFFWLFIGMSLYSVQSLLLLFSGEYILNKAPLHAITIGFFTSMLIAMASRVTMGHSGRMLHLDRVSWYLFFGLQLTAISRIMAELQFNNLIESHVFNLLAVFLWLLSLAIWAYKYAPMYLSRRVDGREG